MGGYSSVYFPDYGYIQRDTEPKSVADTILIKTKSRNGIEATLKNSKVELVLLEEKLTRYRDIISILEGKYPEHFDRVEAYQNLPPIVFTYIRQIYRNGTWYFYLVKLSLNANVLMQTNTQNLRELLNVYERNGNGDGNNLIAATIRTNYSIILINKATRAHYSNYKTKIASWITKNSEDLPIVLDPDVTFLIDSANISPSRAIILTKTSRVALNMVDSKNPKHIAWA